MELSVVVPTLNGCDRLAACLDTLSARASDAEIVVVNGPSADGTSGMVRERSDVDILIETASRNRNVARNAGIAAAAGEWIALLGDGCRVNAGWLEALGDGLAAAAAVTGPVVDPTPQESRTVPEHATFRGRRVTFLDGRNVAFRAEALEALDGFDEYLETGGDRDVAHRLAALDRGVVWRNGMSARDEVDPDGFDPVDWGWRYRARTYTIVKNYGVRPSVAIRLAADAADDAYTAARETLRGEGTPSAWFGNGRDVVLGGGKGTFDGFVARVRDRTSVRNPHGISARADRAVARHDLD